MENKKDLKKQLLKISQKIMRKEIGGILNLEDTDHVRKKVKIKLKKRLTDKKS